MHASSKARASVIAVHRTIHLAVLAVLLLTSTCKSSSASGSDTGTTGTDTRQKPSIQTSSTIYKTHSSIAPRLQWHENHGYCGEVSFIQAGLAMGQYTSQYTARAIATPLTKQDSEGSQLLIGANDTCTASRMGLDYVQFKGGGNTADFLTWIKAQLSLGRIVIIGVYANQSRFNGKASGGDPDYDHIVTVTQIETTHPCKSPGDCVAIGDDIITIEDHGLFSSECDSGNRFLCSTGSASNLCNSHTYSYLYSYSVRDFTHNRQEANAKNGSIYSVPKIDSSHTIANYGIAIKGLTSPQDGKRFYPISLNVEPNYECPRIDEGSANAPIAPGNSITLRGTVSGLTSGQSYNLLQYDDFASLPPTKNGSANCDINFQQKPAIPSKMTKFTAASDTHQFSVKSTSEKTVIFRVIRAD